jgi:hypothetical protein
MCWGHHTAHHEGTLIIRGTADALEVIRLDDECLAAETTVGNGDGEPVDSFHVEIPGEKVNEVAAFQSDAVLALKTLGFTKDVARRAVRDALEHDAPHDLEGLIKAALRRCGST